MISPDLLLALLILVAALVVVSLGIAVAVIDCCLNRDQDDDAQLPDELEVAPSAQPPPPVEAVQMASMAMILLDYVTYPRQNASASASASAGGGDGSTEASGRTSASEDCAICLGPFEDGDWCSVMPICRHEFHQDCIADWLMAYNNSCPLCRAQLQWLAVAQDMV